MLTIPDDLLDAARMDNASEWKVFWKIVLPLSAPALAVLTESERFTLQLARSGFQGESQTSWSNLLAMTVLTLLAITIIFAVLQKYITQGIAQSGVK